MKSSTYKLVKTTAIYFIGNVLSKIILFLLLPIYTKFIPAADMGYYDTSVTLITLFSSVLFLDIGTTILRFKLENSEQNNIFSLANGLVIFIISSFLYFFIFVIIGYFSSYENYFWIILYGFLYSAHSVAGYCTRALGKNFDYAVSGLIQTLVVVVLNIFLIIHFHYGYKSLLISSCFASLISILYMIIRINLFKEIILFRINIVKLIEMLRFALPLCINSIAFWLLTSSSRIMVYNYLGSEAVGYLSVANKFNQIIYLLSSSIQLTWQERAFSHDISSTDSSVFFSRGFVLYYKSVMYFVALLIPGIAIGLSIFPTFLDASYSASILLIPSSIIGTGLAIISTFLGTVFSSLKKTSVISVSTFTGAIVCIITNYLLLRMNIGPVSANYAIIIGYLVTLGIRILILRKIIGLKIEVLNAIIIALMIIIISIIVINCNIKFVIAGLFGLVFISLFIFRKP
jgi:O-antigen/teichoic acid export membrane protein